MWTRPYKCTCGYALTNTHMDTPLHIYMWIRPYAYTLNAALDTPRRHAHAHAHAHAHVRGSRALLEEKEYGCVYLRLPCTLGAGVDGAPAT